MLLYLILCRFDEHALIDLPAMVDYVLQVSGQKQLFYVGHSQGTIMGFAGFTHNQTLASRIKLFFALAPVTTVKHIKGAFRVMADFKDELSVCSCNWLFGVLGMVWNNSYDVTPQWDKFITLPCVVLTWPRDSIQQHIAYTMKYTIDVQLVLVQCVWARARAELLVFKSLSSIMLPAIALTQYLWSDTYLHPKKTVSSVSVCIFGVHLFVCFITLLLFFLLL